MLDGPLLTAEQFIDSRFSLPESGQWAELHGGKVQIFQPPDLDHGTAILNLSKVLADYVQTHRHGYPCFDLGLLMETDPDTIRFPAASYFLRGNRFDETDKTYTDTLPAIVIEMASTSDRRQSLPRRAEDYLAWGVAGLWIIDPASRELLLLDQTGREQRLAEGDTLTESQLPGFECDVEQLFVEPSWWTSQ
ncbi:Uma2 family endonuclease [Rubinisphaera margarita]|uniref:Uma2 family endonuclease n=1 Tax=Rubinisphaera margarita TaxID=2909586 RepID=UPI001EE930C0|nr:Uma2 family endonuclease [Rubinisphaera margarita]MCG6155120.1 Uma2 family endonuclease [Rubinisphaera margarita]